MKLRIEDFINESIKNRTTQAGRKYAFFEAMGAEEIEARKINESIKIQEKINLRKEKKMAKTKDTDEKQPEVYRADKTPEQALMDDWPVKHRQLAPYITEKGQIRGGLKPSETKKAKEILKQYGFVI